MRSAILTMALLSVPAISAGQDRGSSDGGLVVEARLVEITATPHCGGFHFAAVARYEVVRVVRGRYRHRHLFVIQGCPELPRTQYDGPPAGSARTFTRGAIQRLVLSRDPIHRRPPLVMDTLAERSLPTFWAVRTDAVR